MARKIIGIKVCYYLIINWNYLLKTFLHNKIKIIKTFLHNKIHFK